MSTATQPPRTRRMPAILTQGFRPFFLVAGTWAIVALAIWIVMLTTGESLPSRFDPLDWHIHEMLFGFVMAAISGFLLTAILNWTKRLPVRGFPLGVLVGLWLLGRLVCLTSLLVPSWLAVVADLSFPVVLVAVAGREIVAGRNWRNLPMVVPVTVLAIANLLMHLEANGFDRLDGMGWRLGLAAVLILISVVAGRIVPSFTRNWLAKQGSSDLPAAHGIPDRIALGVLHLGLLGWAFWPTFQPVGALLLVGAAVNAWRLLRWRGQATLAEPLVVVLHVGYAWLAAGAALLGLTTIGVNVPLSAAVHALTTGAIATMILAVMTRATLGHTGRSLTADTVTILTYLFVCLAAAFRLAAAFSTEWTMPLIIASASCWIAAFGLFVVRYGPYLLGSRPPRPG